VDYQLPSKERLNAEYTGDDNARHTPVMLHRAVLGSLERFIGILIENYAGALPAWLSPRQVVVVPIGAAFDSYAGEVAETLAAAGFRVTADLDNDRMNAKIRKHQAFKVPYQLVVGQKEMDEKAVAVRYRDGRQEVMPLAAFAAYLAGKVTSRSVEL